MQLSLNRNNKPLKKILIIKLTNNESKKKVQDQISKLWTDASFVLVIEEQTESDSEEILPESEDRRITLRDCCTLKPDTICDISHKYWCL